MIRSWKVVKRSGTYYRKMRSERETFDKKVELMKEKILLSLRRHNVSNNVITEPASSAVQQPTTSNYAGSNKHEMAINNIDAINYDDHYYCYDSCEYVLDSGDNHDSDVGDNDMEDVEIDVNDVLRDNLRNWALQFGISHLALCSLLKIIEMRVGENCVPQDARTLLQTHRNVIPVQALSGGGEYWHNGLTKCLSNAFQNLKKPISISLNINIDGIPVFNSSKVSFWPILSNITEFPKISPMVVGIYCGGSKITDIGRYFSPLVDELEEIMANGVYINSHKVSVALRCFVCDSPARAFVKGMNSSAIQTNLLSYIHTLSIVFHYTFHRCCKF